MIRRTSACAAALIVVIFAGSCGEDNGDGVAADGTQADPASFASEARELCTDFRDRAQAEVLEPLEDDLKQSGLTSEEFAKDEQLVTKTARVLESELLPRYRELIDDLRALEPPPEDAEAVAGVLDAYQQTYEGYEANPISIIDPDADAAIDDAEAQFNYTLCESTSDPTD